METYILRIYRRQAGQTEQIVGMSENVETGEKKGFQNFHQLRAIMTAAQSKSEQYNGPKQNENKS